MIPENCCEYQIATDIYRDSFGVNSLCCGRVVATVAQSVHVFLSATDPTAGTKAAHCKSPELVDENITARTSTESPATHLQQDFSLAIGNPRAGEDHAHNLPRSGSHCLSGRGQKNLVDASEAPTRNLPAPLPRTPRRVAHPSHNVDTHRKKRSTNFFPFLHELRLCEEPKMRVQGAVLAIAALVRPCPIASKTALVSS